MAVAVIIDKGASGAPGFAGACNAGLFADIGERAVTIVVIQNVFAEVSDVKIFPAVVVVIADADALAPSGVEQAALPSDIGKCTIMIVVVEMAGGGFGSGKTFEGGAVDDEDVRPAVIVVIEDGDAGPGGFNDVFLGVDAAKDDDVREAGLFRDVGEISDGLGVFIGYGREGADILILRRASEGKNEERQERREPYPRALETEQPEMEQAGEHELLAC